LEEKVVLKFRFCFFLCIYISPSGHTGVSVVSLCTLLLQPSISVLGAVVWLWVKLQQAPTKHMHFTSALKQVVATGVAAASSPRSNHVDL